MKAYAFIWDLDGTLLDSYEEIVSSVQMVLAESGIPKKKEEILFYVIQTSVKDYLIELAEEYGFSYEEINEKIQFLHHQRWEEVTAAPHAKRILQYLKESGSKNFVFTHRDRDTALAILQNTGLLPYFEELLSVEDGFERKPAPDGVNYLLEKYRLDPKSSFYVGDREVDMRCGKNAGIKTIFYLPPESVGKTGGIEDYVISDFDQIRQIIEEKGMEK